MPTKKPIIGEADICKFTILYTKFKFICFQFVLYYIVVSVSIDVIQFYLVFGKNIAEQCSNLFSVMPCCCGILSGSS